MPAFTDDGATARIVLNSLSELSLDGYLMVDPVSMAALQIFQEDKHPSAMGIGGCRVGWGLASGGGAAERGGGRVICGWG